MHGIKGGSGRNRGLTTTIITFPNIEQHIEFTGLLEACLSLLSQCELDDFMSRIAPISHVYMQGAGGYIVEL